jgi:2-methylisocitrate lyase-like PEP mutase family enzyme
MWVRIISYRVTDERLGEVGKVYRLVTTLLNPRVALVREIAGPLNIIVSPGAPSAPELFKLGVTRVSIGAGAMLATMGLVRDIADELREQGTYEQIALHAYAFPQAWKLFQQK